MFDVSLDVSSGLSSQYLKITINCNLLLHVMYLHLPVEICLWHLTLHFCFYARIPFPWLQTVFSSTPYYPRSDPRYSSFTLMFSVRLQVENGEGRLDKEATSQDDLFDAFRMSLQFWH